MAKDMIVPYPQSNSESENMSGDVGGSLLILNHELLPPPIWIRVRVATGVYPEGPNLVMS